MSEPILTGLRVIDAATYIAGPSCAAILSDYGAEVIKIERPPYGDPFRHLYKTPGMPVSEYNYPFIVDNRNKRSLALNLGTPEGGEIFKKLARQADVLVTNYQPQMLTRFRIRYEDLEPINPRLIYASITGYGEVGEEAEKPGYDMTAYFARSGLMSYLHNADAEPCTSPCGFGDHPTAVSLFSGVMLALYQRMQTGRGSKVTTTLMHNGTWSNASLVQSGLVGAEWPKKWSRREAPNPLVNHYATADGRRFILCLLDPAKDWPKLCGAVGRKDLVEDPRFATTDARRENCFDFVTTMDAEFAKHSMEEWARRFQAHDVLFGIVPTTAEVADDPQLAANGVFVEMTDAPIRTIDSPMRVEGLNKRAPQMPPEIGQHSRAILAELGYSADQIAQCERDGTILDGVAG
ncbi:MAG: CoA transferase [Bryobacterales bacterium]|nr:CoA transferase [Bryobacterales bacterium]